MITYTVNAITAQGAGFNFDKTYTSVTAATCAARLTLGKGWIVTIRENDNNAVVKKWAMR